MTSNPRNTLGKTVGPESEGIRRMNEFDPVDNFVKHGDLHEAPNSFYTVTLCFQDLSANLENRTHGFIIPWNARLWHISSRIGTLTASNGTFDVTDDGTSILTASQTVLSGGSGETASIATTKRDIASGSQIRISVTQTGAGALKDVTCVLTFQRL